VVGGFLAMKAVLSSLLCATLLLPVLFPIGGWSVRAEAAALPAVSLLPAWASSLGQPLPPAVVEPDLARALAHADPDDFLPVILLLRQQPAPERLVAPAGDRLSARAGLVSALQGLAARTQAGLRADLEQARVAGDVDAYTSFWVFNGLAVRARPAFIRALAARPEVAEVRLDHYRRWLDEPDPMDEPRPSTPSLTAFGTPVEPLAVPEWNIARIRAPEVWASLHISGTGAVVAGMDTGVDWLHPALQANYRGYNPHGPSTHVGNWFDAVNGSLYPVDDHGHGTHTMGTAVGQGGIGVAPGARWIAVKVLNSAGYGYDSWIHAGFQWLLAPGGDPARAPDVVNNSWGSLSGADTTFQLDLRALRAAGILPVFANGNSGPAPGTVGSPASLPEALAVGATDEHDTVASFSSRGPSPWGEVRPHVAAPGVHVRSSLPGGLYGVFNGTSMAAPHVTGVAALLRAVSPTLSLSRLTFVITSTARPLSGTLPNNDSGWGLVDGFGAVAALTHPGFISGTVRRADNGSPVPWATVVATVHGGAGSGSATTDGAGAYSLALAPDFYDLTVSAFGYQTATVWGVQVVTGATTVVDVSLTPLPAGVLRGQVTDAASGQPLSATVAVLGTPLSAVGTAYTLTIPAGEYTLRARRLGSRVVTATAAITAGQVTTVNLSLPPAPSILLLDSGEWYYDSQIGYFRQALDDLAYAYDEWSVRRLPDDVPQAGDLAPYDVVIWSAPWDAPGFIGAQRAITGYLDAGGRLLLSGQDVGHLDGEWQPVPYYQRYLKVYLSRDNALAWTLHGTPDDLFAGLTLTIAGAGGADNQEFPDEIGIADPDAAVPVLTYEGAGCGGVRVGTCLDYRVVYLSFGFEAINDRQTRRLVMDRALDWLAGPLPTIGLEVRPAEESRIGLPGSALTYSLRVRHLGLAGVTDTVNLEVTGAEWPVELRPPALVLAPCASATVALTVTVPCTAAWDARDVFTLTARSSLSPTLRETAVFTAKVPAPVLLVDDDLFVEQQPLYRATMDTLGLAYDVWQTCPPLGACWERSPSLEVLRRYPLVVWWTGYDWHRPVTPDQEATLLAYLAQGGRLFLSSQDFLYYHFPGPLSQGPLGVLRYSEQTTPTLASGVPEHPVGVGLGSWALAYPDGYQNWSDAVEPTPGTAVVLRDQARRGLALARRSGATAAVFFAFPFEALPATARPTVMERVVGWLSWLGRSTFTADRPTALPGDTLTYTLRLENDGPVTVTASLSNTLPDGLHLLRLSGPATFISATRLISWDGPLAPGAALTVTCAVTVAEGLAPGAVLTNTARLGLEEQRVHFDRIAVVRVGGADLTPSALECAPSPARSASVVTCALTLVNAGPGDVSTATAVIPVPGGASLVTPSLAWSGGGTAWAGSLGGVPAVWWAGPLTAGGRVTITCPLTLPATPLDALLYGVAFLEDDAGGMWERSTYLTVEPWRHILPVVYRRWRSDVH
jgi:uncharacterized repeat protein (TIGR01451 family)